jgi:hypothetical protein
MATFKSESRHLSPLILTNPIVYRAAVINSILFYRAEFKTLRLVAFYQAASLIMCRAFGASIAMHSGFKILRFGEDVRVPRALAREIDRGRVGGALRIGHGPAPVTPGLKAGAQGY